MRSRKMARKRRIARVSLPIGLSSPPLLTACANTTSPSTQRLSALQKPQSQQTKRESTSSRTLQELDTIGNLLHQAVALEAQNTRESTSRTRSLHGHYSARARCRRRQLRPRNEARIRTRRSPKQGSRSVRDRDSDRPSTTLVGQYTNAANTPVPLLKE